MKPFDAQLHEENDAITKDKVADYIRLRWGCSVSEGTQYGVDLVCQKDNTTFYAEVERRHNWSTVFPFQTVHVPCRKKKFFELDHTTLLFAVRQDLGQALWCNGTDIMVSPIEEKDNKYCEAEPFFVVPLDKWKLIELLPF